MIARFDDLQRRLAASVSARTIDVIRSTGDLTPLFDEVRRAADAVGRDPQALRVMAGCPDASVHEPFPALEQLAAAGVSRVVLSAHAFAADPDELLGRFGERVIAALR